MQGPSEFLRYSLRSFNFSQRQEINTEKYWRYNFPALMSSREIEKYVVLSVEPMLSVQRASAKRRSVSLFSSYCCPPIHSNAVYCHVVSDYLRIVPSCGE